MSPPDPAAALDGSPLGRATGYPDRYAPDALFAIARAPQREAIGIGAELPFGGCDQWTAYELTWLGSGGRPQVALATIEVPADSPSIVESKSMKLYLGSFAQTQWRSAAEVAAVLRSDLARVAGAAVAVTLAGPEQFAALAMRELAGESIDALDADCDRYDVDPSSLGAHGAETAETLVTRLFRSVCPVTGQPDIASVQIAYRGPPIDRVGLLRYLVSYRRHPGFHEHCVERIFVDVMRRCRPAVLSVYARFTRRGGIEINPFRSNAGAPPPPNVRTPRQ
ncbi:MAG: NADPH-dependent 7-cyano-7-deazaguanine reductase QueF [Proteobacteria bacterium]|jgi:7-cyano-7-deazaguanine reductase|nr:NADPH-dependent 7-cyano-7-deazaguanine reductase QueF [Pseudomonadota bacterium]